MNPLILTIIIALGTFILAIFSALFLNQQGMKNYIEAKFEGLEGRLTAEFKTVASQLDSVNHRIDNLETRMDRIERQLDQIFKPILPKS